MQDMESDAALFESLVTTMDEFVSEQVDSTRPARSTQLPRYMALAAFAVLCTSEDTMERAREIDSADDLIKEN